MQKMLNVFLGLYLAHLLTDFVFQSDSLITAKKRGQLSGYAKHGAIHALLAVLILGCVAPSLTSSFRFYAAIAGLTAIHLGLDCAKIGLRAKKRVPDGAGVFLGDQFFHMLTVALAAAVMVPPVHALWAVLLRVVEQYRQPALVVLVAYVGTIFGGGYLVRAVTKPMYREACASADGGSGSELTNAGLYIGWLERATVLTSLVLRSPATVGLIIAAKSIARYPEMKSQSFAEYFLIGTLFSIGLALVGGMLLLHYFYGTFLIEK
jgi:hypothetical protein